MKQCKSVSYGRDQAGTKHCTYNKTAVVKLHYKADAALKFIHHKGLSKRKIPLQLYYLLHVFYKVAFLSNLVHVF